MHTVFHQQVGKRDFSFSASRPLSRQLVVHIRLSAWQGYGLILQTSELGAVTNHKGQVQELKPLGWETPVFG